MKSQVMKDKFEKICLGRKKPPWFTTGPDGMAHQALDLQFFEFCEANKCYDEAQNSWMTRLVSETGTVLRHNSSEKYHITLLGVGHAVICLNADLGEKFEDKDEFDGPFEEDPRGEFFEAHASTNMGDCMSAEFMFRPDEYMVANVQVVSPLWMRSHGATKAQSTISMKRMSDDEPVLVWAARRAFPTLGRPQLYDLVMFLEIDAVFNKQSDVFDLCLILMKDILSPLGMVEADFIPLLQLRCEQTDAQTEVLRDDAVIGLLDEPDQKVVLAEIGEEEGQELARQGVQDKVLALIVKHREAALVAAWKLKGTAQKVALKKIATDNYGGAFPKFKADPSTTEAWAQSMMPARCRIYKDVGANRWILHSRVEHCCRSRSWLLWGHEESLLLLLRWCWSHRLRRDGISVLEWTVEGRTETV